MKVIKSYIDFLNENFGEWVENISGNDEDILEIVNKEIKEFDSSIRIANAVNLLNKDKKEDLLNIISKKRSDLTYSGILENTEQIGGKNIFKSFLRIIIALGNKDIDLSWDKLNEDYVFLLKSKKIQLAEIKEVFSRYEFFNSILEKIKYNESESFLYFGLKSDMVFEYGVSTEIERKKFGEFIINKSNYNWLLLLESVAINNLRKLLVDFEYDKIVMLCRLRKHLNKHKKPNYFIIKEKIITFGYYGEGKWDGENIDEDYFNQFKIFINKILLMIKADNIYQINYKAHKYWIYISLKHK